MLPTPRRPYRIVVVVAKMVNRSAGRGVEVDRGGCSAFYEAAILQAMYSTTVLDHFRNPRNAGELPTANVSVEVTNPVCGDILRLSVEHRGGQVLAARFQARGCVPAIAAGSLLTELMIGHSIETLRSLSPAVIAEQLGGLPPASFHAAQLAHEAVQALLRCLQG